MKHTLYTRWWVVLLALALVLPACKGRQKNEKEKPTATAKDAIPADLAKAYKEDAHRLAARELNSKRRSGDPQVNLPTERVDYFYQLLVQAYRMMQSEAEIPDLSYIHTRQNPPLREIIVFLEPDCPFADEWKTGRTSTSNLYLNQVMGEHMLKIKSFNEGPIGTMAVLEAPKFINTKDLAFIFSNIEGVKSAEPNSVVGESNDISWTTGGKNGYAIKFSKGWGDCPSGCIYRAYWSFYVGENDELNYMGLSGDDPNQANSNGED